MANTSIVHYLQNGDSVTRAVAYVLLAMSLARNVTARATSSGWPIRPSGVTERIQSWVAASFRDRPSSAYSPRVRPGATTLIRTPLGPSSGASARAS